MGQIIIAQSFLHTLGWTIIEGKLYQPQPAEYSRLMTEMYIIFGVVAMFLLTLMLMLGTQTAIRWFGYEFFKATHWIIAVLYIGACWGHWDKLWCWMVPSLALIAIDQILRALKTCYMHMRGKSEGAGFRAAQADMKTFGQDDDVVVRLDFEHEHRETWKAGQHFHICFPSLSIWQSHPFTPSSMPDPCKRTQHHTYIIRVRGGQTVGLAQTQSNKIPVLLTGPYGNGHPQYEIRNVLAIAGGTGVTFTLPVALQVLRQNIISRGAVDFVWIVRRSQDLLWIATDLSELVDMVKEMPSLRISVFVTRESRAASIPREHGYKESASESSSESCSSRGLDNLLEKTSPAFSITFLSDHRPSIAEVVDDFMDRSASNGDNVEIVGSRPEELGSDLRSAVANIKSTGAVDFYWDSRG